MGANEFLIEFGGQTKPVKLKDVACWQCEADSVPAALHSELEAAQKVSGKPLLAAAMLSHDGFS